MWRSKAISSRREFTNFNYLDFMITFYGSEIGFYRMPSPEAMTMRFHAIKSRSMREEIRNERA